MRDYYRHTRNILRVTERITEQFVSGHVTSKMRALFSFLPLTRAHKRPIGDSFFVRNKQLHPADRDVFRNDPEQMMHAFQLAQERNLDLSPELEDLLSRSLRHMTRTYQYARGPRMIFKSILSQKGRVGRILRMMHGVDFLGRYIPEFGQLTCLVQHEFLHRYTADEHTLVCIDKLDALTVTNESKLIPYRKLFEQLADPLVLYLALLLHDSGKAVGRPHSEASALFAQRVAARLQLSSEQRKSLILLVDHHLTLSKMAQQRNLDDPATVMEFAQIVKDQKNLDALMLLTLADGQGASADAWSDWKESLVWQLFHDTSRYLADRKILLRTNQNRTRKACAPLSPTVLHQTTQRKSRRTLSACPTIISVRRKVPEILDHVKLFRSFLENVSNPRKFPLAPAVKWKIVPEHGHTVMTFLHLGARTTPGKSCRLLFRCAVEHFKRRCFSARR